MDKYPRTLALIIAVPVTVLILTIGTCMWRSIENRQARKMALIQQGYTRLDDGTIDGLWLRLGPVSSAPLK